MQKMCLGTVQFGMNYGINNEIRRQPTIEESIEMIDIAVNNGIDVIDTARAYGNAELVLGEYFKKHQGDKKIKVISKLRPNVIENKECDIESVIVREIEDSLIRIGIDKLDGYLLHTPEYIYDERIVKALLKVKERGYTNNIGVSIYNLKEGFEAIRIGDIDYIQLPYSILDQRGKKDNFIDMAKKNNIKIYTRSAFLQGLFMMDKSKIPEHLKKAIPYMNRIEHIIEKYDIDLIDAILGFVKSEENIDYLVFGVETKKQLLEDLYRYNNAKIDQRCITELKSEITDIDDSIILPSLWSNGKKAE